MEKRTQSTAWTDEEIIFLKKNYKKKKAKYCAEYLKKTKGNIKWMVSKLNLSYIVDDKFNLDHEQFTNPNTAEIAYMLGFLWADGYIEHSKKYNSCKTCLKIVSNDMKEIKHLFDSTGTWKCYTYKTKDTWQSTTTLSTTNPFLYNFLLENDYDKKSFVSPTKILKVIPDELKCYFFLVFSDGDGCFYINKNNPYSYCKQYSIAGTYNQDWCDFENLMEEFGCDYTTENVLSKKGYKSSFLRITNKKSLLSFGKYIYKTIEKDKIGLKRKYNKFIEIKNHFKNSESNPRSVYFVKNNI